VGFPLVLLPPTIILQFLRNSEEKLSLKWAIIPLRTIKDNELKPNPGCKYLKRVEILY
jgi:hypothetical protein